MTPAEKKKREFAGFVKTCRRAVDMKRKGRAGGQGIKRKFDLCVIGALRRRSQRQGAKKKGRCQERLQLSLPGVVEGPMGLVGEGEGRSP